MHYLPILRPQREEKKKKAYIDKSNIGPDKKKKKFYKSVRATGYSFYYYIYSVFPSPEVN